MPAPSHGVLANLTLSEGSSYLDRFAYREPMINFPTRLLMQPRSRPSASFVSFLNRSLMIGTVQHDTFDCTVCTHACQSTTHTRHNLTSLRCRRRHRRRPRPLRYALPLLSC